MTSGIFYEMFLLVNEYLCGGALTFDQVEAWLPLIVGTVCAFATVAVIALPFCAVYCFAKAVFAGFWRW